MSIMGTLKLLYDPYDKWGSCQEARFTIADILFWEHFHRVDGYTPGVTLFKGYSYKLINRDNPSIEELKYAYAILTRYHAWLKAAGKDY